MHVPLGDHATAHSGVVWPPKVRSCLPLVASQTCAVPSWLAEARRVLSGDQVTCLTAAAWPW